MQVLIKFERLMKIFSNGFLFIEHVFCKFITLTIYIDYYNTVANMIKQVTTFLCLLTLSVTIQFDYDQNVLILTHDNF